MRVSTWFGVVFDGGIAGVLLVPSGAVPVRRRARLLQGARSASSVASLDVSLLGNVPLVSDKEMYVQLLDQAGLPLSEKVFLATSTDCEKNLILVRFKRNR